MEILTDSPNTTSAAPIENAVPSLDAIAEKMAAMRSRNLTSATEPTATGETEQADAVAPVAPEGVEVSDDTETTEPEVAATETQDAEAGEESESPDDSVSSDDTTDAEVIDFIEFAETHPNAKFKFMRNGKEIEIDAKKAASILGQGAAISEDARQLKVQRAEFDEYVKEQYAQQQGLTLAMEFTVAPRLKKAYDEIVKTQQYQQVFQQQLAQTQDPAEQARIQANIKQNEAYIAQQGEFIRQVKPKVDQFQQMRTQQVQEILEQNRKQFKDTELKNEYVYNEIRDKVMKGWAGAEGQLVPGVKNIDLISSDEHIMSLLRDGLKYRDKPVTKSAGNSIAAVTTKRAGQVSGNKGKDDLSDLREKAKSGDKKAQDNLLVAQLQKIRASRGR